MPIVVACQSCKKKKKAPDHLAGKKVRCKCGAVMKIPDGDIPFADDDGGTELSDIALMGDGQSLDHLNCPGCGAAMTEGALVCMRCGFNRKTGERISVAVDAPPPEAAAEDHPKKQKQKKKAASDDREPSALPGQLIKLTLILLVIGGVAYGTIVLKESVFFSPGEQCEKDLAKITAGMSIKQVVDIVGNPPREVLTERDPDESDDVTKYLPKKLVYSADMMKKFSKEELKYGFRFVYKYSERAELVIFFDETGTVITAEKEDPQDLLWNR